MEQKVNRGDRVQKLRQLGITYNKVDTKIYGKKEEEGVTSAFHVQSQVDLDKPCTNKRCIRKGVPKHTARRCKFGKD